MKKNQKKMVLSTSSKANFSSYEFQKMQWNLLRKMYLEFGMPGLSHLICHNPDKSQVEHLIFRDKNGKLCGFLEYYRDLSCNKSKAGVAFIFVDPDYQKKGIGKKLIFKGYEKWVDFNAWEQETTYEGDKLLQSISRMS